MKQDMLKDRNLKPGINIRKQSQTYLRLQQPVYVLALDSYTASWSYTLKAIDGFFMVSWAVAVAISGCTCD